MAVKDKDRKKDEKKKGDAAGGVQAADRHDFSYTQNRELSWLRFDDRVLAEAYDETVPLFERLKFVSIFESNLDEFFMIRIGGLSDLATLKHQPRDNKSNLTPAEQIDRVFDALPPLYERQTAMFHTLEDELAKRGMVRLEPSTLVGDERTFVEGFFKSYISPIISPLVIDPRHPFPNLRNGGLYLVCGLEVAPESDESGLLGLIEVPPSLPRVIEIPSNAGEYHYILVEDIIMACVDRCFGTYVPQDRAIIRVIRNADIGPRRRGRRGRRGLSPAHEAHPQEAPAPAARLPVRPRQPRALDRQAHPPRPRAVGPFHGRRGHPARPGLRVLARIAHS